jgi:addiction module RelE/StbE family toxin
LQIRWTRRASCDLDAVGDYIGRADETVAARVVLRILAAVEQLVDHPHRGRPGRIPNTRELVIPNTPHIVPYRVKGDAMEVLRVMRGAMRWPDSV